jgi:hypothetical protein
MLTSDSESKYSGGTRTAAVLVALVVTAGNVALWVNTTTKSYTPIGIQGDTQPHPQSLVSAPEVFYNEALNRAEALNASQIGSACSLRGLRVLLENAHVEGNLGDEMETTPVLAAFDHWCVNLTVVLSSCALLNGWRRARKGHSLPCPGALTWSLMIARRDLPAAIFQSSSLLLAPTQESVLTPAIATQLEGRLWRCFQCHSGRGCPCRV